MFNCNLCFGLDLNSTTIFFSSFLLNFLAPCPPLSLNKKKTKNYDELIQGSIDTHTQEYFWIDLHYYSPVETLSKVVVFYINWSRHGLVLKLKILNKVFRGSKYISDFWMNFRKKIQLTKWWGAKKGKVKWWERKVYSIHVPRNWSVRQAWSIRMRDN